MYIRRKKTPNSPRQSIQIVEGYRDSKGNVKQRIVRHLGVFVDEVELASQLLNAKTHNYESKFIDSVKRFHLIVVDELGYVPIKVDARFLLFEVFAKLYEQFSLIITTHLRFEEWGDIFGNAKATKVMIDRLTHHCHIIETDNKSFRGGKDVN